MTLITSDQSSKKPLDGKAIAALVGGGVVALGAVIFTVVSMTSKKPVDGPKKSAEEQAMLDKAAKAKADAKNAGARINQADAGSGSMVDAEGNILNNKPANVEPELKNQFFNQGGQGQDEELANNIKVRGNSEDRYYNSERARDEQTAQKENRAIIGASCLAYSTNPGASWAAVRPNSNAGDGKRKEDPLSDSGERVDKLLGSAERMLANGVPNVAGSAQPGAGQAVLASNGGGGGITGNRMPAQRMGVPANPGEMADMRIGSTIGPDDVIREGKFLDGVMVNRVESDIAESPVMVQLTRDFVSLDGKTVLFPAGAMAYGVAGTVGNMQQVRMYVSFHKIVFPRRPGERIQQAAYFPTRNLAPILDNMGSIGVQDQVNRHLFLKFGSAICLGIFDGFAASIQNVGSDGAVQPDRRDLITAQMSQNFSQVMNTIIQQYSNVVPTITIREGKKVKIYFTQDTMVSPYMLTKNLSFVRQ